jgi:hypothetical protein
VDTSAYNVCIADEASEARCERSVG